MQFHSEALQQREADREYVAVFIPARDNSAAERTDGLDRLAVLR